MVKIFQTELHGLATQVGHGVTLGITATGDVAVADLLNDFEKDASGRYKLPNLHAGSPLEIVVRLNVPAKAAAATAKLAEFDLSYVGTTSQLPEKIITPLDVEFASAEIVSRLAEDLDVAKAVTLLMNARARREAMSRMDRGDFIGARAAMAAAANDIEVMFCALPDDADLRREKEDLDETAISFARSPSDPMTRKRMAYRRESLRKSR